MTFALGDVEIFTVQFVYNGRQGIDIIQFESANDVVEQDVGTEKVKNIVRQMDASQRYGIPWGIGSSFYRSRI